MEKTAADILEIAAQSYEAETVNWCQEAWVDPDLIEEWNIALRRAPNGAWGMLPHDAATNINACAMGAMALADGWTWQQNMEFTTERIIKELGSDELRAAVGALEDHLELDHNHSDGYAIAWWNDKDERTKDQVIEAMKATAKDLRNQGDAA